MPIQTLPLAALAAALLAVLPAAAQTDEDGCDPCALVVSVDEEGMSDTRDWNATLGDRYVLEVHNLDAVEHVVTLAGFGVTLTVPPYGTQTSQPFELTEAHLGEHQVLDQQTGASMTFRVLREDAVSHDMTAAQGSSSTSSTRTPGPALPLLAAAVVALALLLRRRA